MKDTLRIQLLESMLFGETKDIIKYFENDRKAYGLNIGVLKFFGRQPTGPSVFYPTSLSEFKTMMKRTMKVWYYDFLTKIRYDRDDADTSESINDCIEFFHSEDRADFSFQSYCGLIFIEYNDSHVKYLYDKYCSSSIYDLSRCGQDLFTSVMYSLSDHDFKVSVMKNKIEIF